MSETAMLAVVGGLFLMFVMMGGGGLVYMRSANARYRKRLATFSGKAEQKANRRSGGGRDQPGARRRQIQGKLKELEDERAEQNKKKRITTRDLLLQADVKLTPKKFFLIGLAIGIVATLVYLVMGYPPLGAIAVFIVVSFGLPRWWLKKKGEKQRKLFTKNFANAVDVIVRGVQSGLPVNECLGIIARESPYPLNTEFQQILDGIKIGQTMGECMEKGLQRIPTTEYKFFSIVLAIQQQTGGNLAETLAGLSSVLRDRKRMEDQVKTMTSEARTTAMIIGSLPFCMTALMCLTSYEYISLLWLETLGHYLIAGGVVLIGTGTLIMKSMINFDI
ncbi:MAG: hypothetical protein CMM46_01560 [Rhodospirillaceae bacterium]|nr:hypothetical protein [Rhodospirillaceae bacterium]|tara:strand:- start:7963 stop:8964 length:1002 start_codon:yes stop_codon:yes gene_type:complete